MERGEGCRSSMEDRATVRSVVDIVVAVPVAASVTEYDGFSALGEHLQADALGIKEGQNAEVVVRGRGVDI